MSFVVTEEHVRYCFKVLVSRLKKEPLPEPNFSNDEYPLFVTWNKLNVNGGHHLRGCIGNFSPLPLHLGLTKYALISALKDRRFSPIRLEEIPYLTCAVSLLTNFEVADHYLDWEIGKHGIWIEFTQLNGEKETATYLPDVMKEQCWTKEEAIESLLRKGDFQGRITKEYCLNSIILTKYQSQKLEMSYKSDLLK